MALDADHTSSGFNSYITEDDADLYFEDRNHVDAWDSLDNKEKALVSASQILDWYMTWKGYKADGEQPMQWPRTGVIRKDGTEVADDIIPRDVKVATCELALSSIDDDRTSDDSLAGISKVKVSSLMIQADEKDHTASHRSVIPEKIKYILKDLISQGGIGVVRLMRA